MAKPNLFSEEERAQFRRALDEFRDPRACAPGRWAVSGLNRRPDLVGPLPESITLRDISLRTMEQIPGVLRPDAERLEFLRRLVRAGLRDLNTGGFLRRRPLEAMQAEVAAAKEIDARCELVYLGPVTEEDFALVARAGYDCVQLMSSYLGAATAILSGPTYHRMWHDRDWRTLRFPTSPADQIARSVRLTRMAKDHGLKVSAGMNLVAYASDGYIADHAGAVSEAGAEEVNLLDSSSALGPEAFGHIVGVARQAAGPATRIGIHAHDMFGLAVASGVAAAKAGASLIEVAVNGYVIGPAQADLAATAVAFEALYGVRTGLDLSQLAALSRAGEELTGVAVPANCPAVGRELFALGEADQYVEEIDVDPLLHKPITPELVGAERPLHVTATTGPFGMWRKLDQLGVKVAKSDVTPILHACWELMEREARALTDEDIAAVARGALDRSGEAPARAGRAMMLHRIPDWVDEVRARRGPPSRNGTARLINAEARKRGAAAIREGRSISLSRPVQNAVNAPSFARSGYQLKPTMRREGRLVVARDELCCDNHGMVNTHIDGLNHFGLDETWHDGGAAVIDADSPSILDWAEEGLVARGVLLDIPGLRGEPWAKAGAPVTPAELDQAVRRAGVTLQRGDAILLHMGRSAFEASGEIYNFSEDPNALRPGIGIEGGRWLSEQEISLVLWDFMEACGPGQSPYSVHVLIWAMGQILVDNCDFTMAVAALADRAEKTGLLVVAPLKLPQGTGCMVNPLLII